VLTHGSKIKVHKFTAQRTCKDKWILIMNGSATEAGDLPMATLKNARAIHALNKNLSYIFTFWILNLFSVNLSFAGFQRSPSTWKLKITLSPKVITVIKKITLKRAGGFCSTNAGASCGKTEKSTKVWINPLSTDNQKNHTVYRVKRVTTAFDVPFLFLHTRPWYLSNSAN